MHVSNRLKAIAAIALATVALQGQGLQGTAAAGYRARCSPPGLVTPRRRAVVTTQPGSKSQQNVQRRGFHLLYTRAILVKQRA